jgi:hypothetical protein
MKTWPPRCALVSCAAGIYICFLAEISSAQMADELARKRAKAETLASLHFDATRYLSTQRREDLEQMFANVATAAGSVLFYKLSNEGDETRTGTVIRHIATDASLNYLVGVSCGNGTVFRIGGFIDSLAEFNRMMAILAIRIHESTQAVAIKDLYLAANPQNVSFVILDSLLDFKQWVERQCHERGGDFSSVDKEFTQWWVSHEMTYRNLKFSDEVIPFDDGFRVRFFTLSAPMRSGKCGAVPIAASIEISNAGQVKPVKFSEPKLERGREPRGT